MRIFERYLLKQFTRNLVLCLAVFVFLFLLFDFFDRIDSLIDEGASLLLSLEYFILKIPTTLTLMFPVAVLSATLFTIGILSKNGEITALRASGVPVWQIARPLVCAGFAVSILSLVLSETIVPGAQRRAREVFNLDIRQRDKKGGYSQSDFWWRSGDRFFSVAMFDSRNNTLHGLTLLSMAYPFQVTKRTEATSVRWVSRQLGWNMSDVTEYQFESNTTPTTRNLRALPLPILDRPETFYDLKTDPSSMSYSELRRFIRKQELSGVATRNYLADLYQKLSSPLINLLAPLLVLPFSMKPARSGSLAVGFLAGMGIGFSYYVIHSFSIALGRAELFPPLFAAWAANLLLGAIAIILNLGAESPQ